MIYTIGDADLQVQISSLGAELQSIRFRGTEYLWQGNDAWPCKAPILFPLVGKLPGGETNIRGRRCAMPMHGFAQHLEFTPVSRSEEAVELEARWTEETLKMYPYRFRLRICYRVENGALIQENAVENLDDAEMLYCFGLHPGFSTENHGLAFEDCCVELHDDTPMTGPTPIPGPRMWDFPARRPIPAEHGVIMLSESLFNPMPVLMDELRSNRVTLRSKAGRKIVDFSFRGFSLLALWHSKNGPFLCLEPWSSQAAIETPHGRLDENPTIRHLAPGAADCYTVRMDFS